MNSGFNNNSFWDKHSSVAPKGRHFKATINLIVAIEQNSNINKCLNSLYYIYINS